MAPKKTTMPVRRSTLVAERAPLPTNKDNIGSATTSVSQKPLKRREVKVVGDSRYVVAESRKATKVGFDSSATDKIRVKATSSESTERRQNQIWEESDIESRSDVSSDGTRNNVLASSQGRERQMDLREDEARWRRSSQERIRPGIYRSQSVIAQLDGKVTNRGRTASCVSESQASASSVTTVCLECRPPRL